MIGTRGSMWDKKRHRRSLYRKKLIQGKIIVSGIMWGGMKYLLKV